MGVLRGHNPGFYREECRGRSRCKSRISASLGLSGMSRLRLGSGAVGVVHAESSQHHDRHLSCRNDATPEDARDAGVAGDSGAGHVSRCLDSVAGRFNVTR